MSDDVPIILDMGGETVSLIYAHRPDCASNKTGWLGRRRRCNCGSHGVISTGNEDAIRAAVRSIFAPSHSATR